MERFSKYFWSEEKTKLFAEEVIKLTREGYTLRNSTELAGNKLGLNFMQSYGLWTKITFKYPNYKDEYIESLNEKTESVIKKINWHKIDSQIEEIMVLEIESGKKPVEISIEIAKKLNMMASDVYLRWHNHLSKKYKKQERKKQKSKEEIQPIDDNKHFEDIKKVVDLHKKGFIESNAFIDVIYKIVEK